MNDVKEVMGIENRTSKSGNNYFLVHTGEPFDARYGVGLRTAVEYISAKYMPSNVTVGSHVRLTYGRSFDGKAYVNGLTVVDDNDGIPTINKK